MDDIILFGFFIFIFIYMLITPMQISGGSNKKQSIFDTENNLLRNISKYMVPTDRTF